MFQMYSIVDNINLSSILFLRVFFVFLSITQVHIQYHVTTIRCISTYINEQKCVQLVAVSKGSPATYFDFWKERNEAYSFSFRVFGANFSPVEGSIPFSTRAYPLVD